MREDFMKPMGLSAYAVANQSRATLRATLGSVLEAGRIDEIHRTARLRFSDSYAISTMTENPWLALLAPANTDKAVVDRLYAAAQEATKDPKVRALFTQQGAEPADLGPEDLRKFIASEISKWSEVIGKIGIEPM